MGDACSMRLSAARHHPSADVRTLNVISVLSELTALPIPAPMLILFFRTLEILLRKHGGRMPVWLSWDPLSMAHR